MRNAFRSHSNSDGFSLIEIMVGMTVGLIASIVIVQVFSAGDTFKRSVSGGSDAAKTAAMVTTYLGRALGDSGAGLANSDKVYLWGCALSASDNTKVAPDNIVLPSKDVFPAPFSAVNQKVRLFPLAIIDGGATESDILISMSGNSASGNRDGQFAAASLTDPSLGWVAPVALALNKGDLMLALTQPVDKVGDCTVQQIGNITAAGVTADTSLGDGAKVVSSTAVTGVPLDTTTFSAMTLSAVKLDPVVYGLGPSPKFSMFGVSANGELVEYDLLKRTGSQVVGENIYLLKARYGVDSDKNDNIVDAWVAPSEANWTMDKLFDGSVERQNQFKQIKAVRIALVTKSVEIVNDTAAKQTQIRLFKDLPVAEQFTFDIPAADQKYQYQTYEWTILLRNMKAVEY